MVCRQIARAVANEYPYYKARSIGLAIEELYLMTAVTINDTHTAMTVARAGTCKASATGDWLLPMLSGTR